MHRSLLVAVSLLVFSTTAAFAGTTQSGFSFGPTVSTLGAGAELGYRFNNSFGVRAKAQGFKIVDGTATTDNGIDYDYDAKLFTAGAVADYYPWASGWRFTGGAYYDDNRVTVNNNGGSTLNVGGVPVPVLADTVRGEGHYNRIAPYLGLGYDGSLGAGFALGFDLGVLYQGKSTVNVSSNNPAVPTADIFNVRDDVKDGMDYLQFYPVVGLNLTYRF